MGRQLLAVSIQLNHLLTRCFSESGWLIAENVHQETVVSGWKLINWPRHNDALQALIVFSVRNAELFTI